MPKPPAHRRPRDPFARHVLGVSKPPRLPRVPGGGVTDHRFEIRGEKQTKRGYWVAFRCSSCDMAGDLTLLTRDKTIRLLGVFEWLHRVGHLPEGETP